MGRPFNLFSCCFINLCSELNPMRVIDFLANDTVSKISKDLSTLYL